MANKWDKATIYVIKCPDTMQICYVGQTLYYESRKKMHLTSNKTASAIGRYMVHLRSLGKEPIFEVHSVVSQKKKWDVESQLIVNLLKAGVLLLNTHGNYSIRSAVEHYLPHEFITDNKKVLRY